MTRSEAIEIADEHVAWCLAQRGRQPLSQLREALGFTRDRRAPGRKRGDTSALLAAILIAGPA